MNAFYFSHNVYENRFYHCCEITYTILIACAAKNTEIAEIGSNIDENKMKKYSSSMLLRRSLAYAKVHVQNDFYWSCNPLSFHPCIWARLQRNPLDGIRLPIHITKYALYYIWLYMCSLHELWSKCYFFFLPNNLTDRYKTFFLDLRPDGRRCIR